MLSNNLNNVIEILSAFTASGDFYGDAMLDDIELLRKYAAEASEEAFQSLLNRHVALVYSGDGAHQRRSVCRSRHSRRFRGTLDHGERLVLGGLGAWTAEVFRRIQFGRCLC